MMCWRDFLRERAKPPTRCQQPIVPTVSRQVIGVFTPTAWQLITPLPTPAALDQIHDRRDGFRIRVRWPLIRQTQEPRFYLAYTLHQKCYANGSSLHLVSDSSITTTRPSPSLLRLTPTTSSHYCPRLLAQARQVTMWPPPVSISQVVSRRSLTSTGFIASQSGCGLWAGPRRHGRYTTSYYCRGTSSSPSKWICTWSGQRVVCSLSRSRAFC